MTRYALVNKGNPMKIYCYAQKRSDLEKKINTLLFYKLKE